VADPRLIILRRCLNYEESKEKGEMIIVAVGDKKKEAARKESRGDCSFIINSIIMIIL